MTRIFGDGTSDLFTLEDVQEVVDMFTTAVEDEKKIKRLFVKDGKLTIEYEDGI